MNATGHVSHVHGSIIAHIVIVDSTSIQVTIPGMQVALKDVQV
jgi:hypothetical protein